MAARFLRRIFLGLALSGVVGAASAVPDAPPPIIHTLGTITALQGLTIDVSVGSENFASKTNQFDVFTFSLDYPHVTNFNVIATAVHDYGRNDDGLVEYAWGVVGDKNDGYDKPSFHGMRLDLLCAGTAAGAATCSPDGIGMGGVVISNYQLPLPPNLDAVPGETYWIGIRNYTDHTTYSLSFVAAPVPEPETYAMLLAGLGLAGAIARRRRQKQ